MIESQGEKISTYIVLPCNVQEAILDEIARAYSTKNLSGCILTKQDESISIAAAVSTSINFKMKIAYVCNDKTLVGIFSRSIRATYPTDDKKRFGSKANNDENLIDDLQPTVKSKREGTYARQTNC